LADRRNQREEIEMNYVTFVRGVEARAAGGLDEPRAQRAIETTLHTLAERISATEAANLAAQLPKQLKPALRARGPREPFDFHEFLGRMAERDGISPSEALDHARAVTSMLAEAVTGHELRRVRGELGAEFDALFAPPAAAGWPETRHHAPHP
jgi:uncharacterized protein (DUF2267 family)